MGLLLKRRNICTWSGPKTTLIVQASTSLAGSSDINGIWKGGVNFYQPGIIPEVCLLTPIKVELSCDNERTFQL